jgi:hypothetical protein
MSAPTPNPNPYNPPAEPFKGLRDLIDAIGNAFGHLLVGLLGFGIMGLAIMWWRSDPPDSAGGMAVRAGVGIGGAALGVWEMANTYNILNNATGGLLGQLLSVVVSLLPLLIVLAIVWLLGQMAGRR